MSTSSKPWTEAEIRRADIAALAEDRFQRADWDEPLERIVPRYPVPNSQLPASSQIPISSQIADEQLVGNGWSQPTPLPGGNWPMQVAMAAALGLLVGSVAFGVGRLAGLL